MQKNRRIWWILGGIGLALGVATAYALPLVEQWRLVHRTHTMLESSDPQDRKRAAWLIVDHHMHKFTDALVSRIQSADQDPDVRETYVYALGRVADDYPDAASVLQDVALFDTSGYVRAAAWLALARLDAEQFEQLAAGREPQDDWAALGIAQGWLAIADTRGLFDLLDAAEFGTHSQRVVAARALDKHARPLLEAIGAWPIEYNPRLGDEWPVELTREVRSRFRQIDAQQLAIETAREIDDAWRVRRNVAKLTKARNRIARFVGVAPVASREELRDR